VSRMTHGEVESFYDGFSRRLLADYVYGNLRVDRQLDFFAAAIPADARRVLVIGCGSGYAAYRVASEMATAAEVLAVDISGRNIEIARALFAHPRVEYRRADVTSEPLEGSWGVILLPDVYEHIPLDSRRALHERLAKGLAERGRILVTVPTPEHQDHLRRSGSGLQPVDERVGLAELTALARDVGGEVTCFCVISAWSTNDYAHAVIERSPESMKLLAGAAGPAIGRSRRGGLLRRGLRLLQRLTGVGRLRLWLLERRVRALARGDDAAAGPRAPGGGPS